MTEQELEEYKKLNNIEKVDVTGSEKLKQTYSNYANYIMIALMMVVQIGISVLSAVDGDIRNAFPKTTYEWIIWVALRLITGVVSFMIFNSFVKEGEKQGKKSEQYKAANKKFMDVFCKNLSKEVKAQSPRAFLAKARGMKAISLTISAVLTGVAIAEATIKTNWTGLLGTIISLIMMVVWGYLKQLEVEEYFVNEYPIYVAVEIHKIEALKAQIKQEEIKDNINNQENKNDALNAQYESQIKGDLINDNDRQSNVS